MVSWVLRKYLLDSAYVLTVRKLDKAVQRRQVPYDRHRSDNCHLAHTRNTPGNKDFIPSSGVNLTFEKSRLKHNRTNFAYHL